MREPFSIFELKQFQRCERELGGRCRNLATMHSETAFNALKVLEICATACGKSATPAKNAFQLTSEIRVLLALCLPMAAPRRANSRMTCSKFIFQH